MLGVTSYSQLLHTISSGEIHNLSIGESIGFWLLWYVLSAIFFFFSLSPPVVMGLSVCWKVIHSPLVTCASKELVSPPAGTTTQWLDCAHRAAMQGPHPVWDWLDHVHFTRLPALLACLVAGFHGSCPVLKWCWTLHYSLSLSLRRSLIAKCLNRNLCS